MGGGRKGVPPTNFFADKCFCKKIVPPPKNGVLPPKKKFCEKIQPETQSCALYLKLSKVELS